MGRSLAHALLACLALLPTLATAQTNPDVDALRREVAEARARLQAESDRLTALEARLASTLGTTPSDGESSPPTPTPTPTAGSGGVRPRLLDVSLVGLFAAGASTANANDLALLEAGGHDPHQRGFTVQNVEMSFLGAVDPYLQAESHIVLQIDEKGETGVELEEAFVRTT